MSLFILKSQTVVYYNRCANIQKYTDDIQNSLKEPDKIMLIINYYLSEPLQRQHLFEGFLLCFQRGAVPPEAFSAAIVGALRHGVL